MAIGGLTWVVKTQYNIQNDTLYNSTPEIYIIILTTVIPTNSIKMSSTKIS